MKTNKKRRYISPSLTGASATLLDLLCNSVRFNIQVKELENMNEEAPDEVFYFES